jgi:hypothetical protein
MKTESQKLQDWIDKEKRNGLIDFKISVTEKFNGNIESLAKEINEMLNAPTIPDISLM